MVDVSVIICYYKRIDYLELILTALNKQTFRSFEVIVSEDNNEQRTVDFIKAIQEKVLYKIKLAQQEDIGFRKNRILNESIRNADGKILVFFDGDCIPHSSCIEEHFKNSLPKSILSGRRVMLSEKFSQKLLETKNINSLTFFNILISGGKHAEEAIYLPYSWVPKKKNRGLLGCNFSLFKQALLEINGFDEDYVKAGVGEDNDIEWRLLKSGYVIQPIKFKAIVYHIHHKSNYSENDVQANAKIMHQKIDAGHVYCLNGINKVNSSEV